MMKGHADSAADMKIEQRAPGRKSDLASQGSCVSNPLSKNFRPCMCVRLCRAGAIARTNSSTRPCSKCETGSSTNAGGGVSGESSVSP